MAVDFIFREQLHGFSVTIASSASGVVFTFGRPRFSASFCPLFAVAIAFKQHFFAATMYSLQHMHDGNLFLFAFSIRPSTSF
jgi:hypothetical protein